MDEIIIEEKKYVSSKQAAKITGYAKDYIGQLCREGRVPSRLVGRSWYVLEAAIKDHRFGSQELKDAAPVGAQAAYKPAEESEKPVSPYPMVEFPRYEASSPEVLPSLNLLNKRESSLPPQDGKSSESEKTPQNLQDSWKEWFDQASESMSTVDVPVTKESVPDDNALMARTFVKESATEVENNRAEEGALAVPLHIVPRERLVEESVSQDAAKVSVSEIQPRASSSVRVAYATLQSIGVLLIAALTLLAVAGSGYLDEYLSSVTQAQLFSGISVYNK